MSNCRTRWTVRGGGLPLMLMATLCSASFGCAASEGTCGTVKYTLTPDSGGAPFDVEPLACTHEPVVNGCTLELYDIPGDNRYFQYGTFGACVGDFQSTIGDGENAYFLSGVVQRTFGSGSGPFAIGTYSDESTGEGGTFTFDEGEFRVEP